MTAENARLRQENKRLGDLLKMSSDSSFEISADMARKHEAEIEPYILGKRAMLAEIEQLKEERRLCHAVIDQLRAGKNVEFVDVEIGRLQQMYQRSDNENARLREALKDMRNAIDMMEGALMRWPELVDLPRKWGTHGLPRHRDELGVTIPGNCGQVYGVCDALAELTRIINSDEYNVR